LGSSRSDWRYNVSWLYTEEGGELIVKQLKKKTELIVLLITTQGTTLLANPHSVFKCKKLFGNYVEEFRPERFLDPGDDSKLSDLRKFVTPFGVGNRACPGEPIAEILTFLFLVSTINNFKLSFVPGEKPPQMEFDVGGTARPKLFRVLVSRR